MIPEIVQAKVEEHIFHELNELKSQSGFGDKILKAVWKEIFAFCLGRTPPDQTLAAKAGRK